MTIQEAAELYKKQTGKEAEYIQPENFELHEHIYYKEDFVKWLVSKLDTIENLPYVRIAQFPEVRRVK